MILPRCRRRFAVSAATLGLALASQQPTLAHGGQYRGPTPVQVGIPGGPTTDPGSGRSGSPTSWASWWEFNKSPFLDLRRAVRDPGAVGPQDRTTTLEPTDAERSRLVLPALNKLLESTKSRDVATACMIAMAKIGLDHPEFEIHPIFLERLKRGSQEIRETAALSLGVSRRADALDDLVALALDGSAGHRLMARSSVDDRTRAFSIYGLGLLAQRNPIAVKRRVFEVCSELLGDGRVRNREVRVALIHALGSLNLDASAAAQKRLLWQALETLDEFYGRDLGRAEQITQSHVPIAIARLLGRGNSPDHERFKQRYLAELKEDSRRYVAIYDSAVLALGRLALPQEVHPADARVHTELVRYSQSGKRDQARYFCLIALGEIGGAAGRAELMKVYQRGNKAIERPWAAIALGVLAHHARAADPKSSVDIVLGRMLLQGLRDVANEQHRAATSVALGLVGYREATDELRKMLQKYRRADIVASYLCTGLALLDAETAIPQLRKLVQETVRRPLTLAFSAIALGRLGDKDAMELLVSVLRSGDQNLAKLSGLATAFGYIGDRRAIEPLIDLMFERDMTTLSRAFVAAALGRISDPLDLPWNAELASGSNYRAAVPTLTNGVSGVLDIL